MANVFKVGEKVKIKTWDELATEFGVENQGMPISVIPCTFGFIPEMKEFSDRIFTIKSINTENGAFKNSVRFEEPEIEESPWNFSIDMLKKL